MSVPAYLENTTLSPTLTCIGSSLVPGPMATTSAICGCSLALLVRMMPPWDFSSASSFFISTLLPSGLIPIDLVLEAIDELDCQDGITFSGGDPMFQPEACNRIALYCKEKGYNIWVYTGFTYEELTVMANTKPIYKEFLSNIDVLVDGRFILEERDLSLLFRGSRNQRLIDVPKTLEAGRVIVLDEYEYNEEKSFERVPMYV